MGTPPFAAAMNMSRHHSPVALWQYFWHLLAAALALRLLVAITCNWAMRPDEAIQYLEQAHRLVFGYGFVPWEFRYGVRTWLIPAIPALPLYFTKIFAIDSPALYIPLVNSWNALLSMSIPVGMYFYTRRAISENTAKWALIFGCFWYEFLIFAPHALAESYAAAFFMSALAIGYGTNNIGRLLFGGLLLGLTFAIRVPYAPLVAAFGIIWLAILPRRLWAYPLGGGVAGLLVWGAVDYWTWGGFWASIINYFIIAPKDAVRFPFWILYADAARVSFGIYAFVLLYAVWHWQKHWRLLAMLATIPAAINYYNREYSNLFIVLPLLWILIAATLNDRRQPSATAKKRRHKKHAKSSPNNRLLKPAIGFIAVISLLGIFNKIPFTPPNIFGHGTNQHPFLFMLTPQYAITQAVRDSLGAETPRAVRWDAAHDALAMGGYYQLHIKTPLYFAGAGSQQFIGNAAAKLCL